MRPALYRAAFVAAAVTSLAAPVAAQAAPPQSLTAPTTALTVTQSPCREGVSPTVLPCTGDELLGSRGTWTDQASLTFR